MAKNISEGRFGVNFSKIFWGRTPTPPNSAHTYTLYFSWDVVLGGYYLGSAQVFLLTSTVFNIQQCTVFDF